MDSEVFDDSDKFATTACQLLREYSERLQEVKREITKMADSFHGVRSSKMDFEYFQRRVQAELMSYDRSRPMYDKLSRKCSQWLEHGKPIRPHLQLEMEIRLDDFERLVGTMEHYIHTVIMR